MNMKYSWIGFAAAMITGGGCAVDSTNANDEENIGEVSQAELVAFQTSRCPYTSAQVGSVDPNKVLIVKDVSVVDDACRTQWTNPTGCSADALGRWTFWQLMENMKGSTPTTAEFVIKFLQQFRDTSPVNSFAMQDRSKIQSLIIDPWRQASGCAPGSWETNPCTTLRKDLAPLRLLAIVNRMDLHADQSSAPPAYGGGDGGEVRFIFGFLDASQYLDASNNYIVGMTPNDLPVLQGTVILEYGVVTDEFFFAGPSFWADQWLALNSMSFGASAEDFNNDFNNQLQLITDSVTMAGIKPSKPNGSALDQIRTNEIDFDPADPYMGQYRQWELREHKLLCASGSNCSDALIRRAPVALTPANSFGYDISINSSSSLPPSTLSDFLQDSTIGPQVDIENYDVPLIYHGQPFRAGASRQGEFFAESQTWVNTARSWSSTFFPGNKTIRDRRHYLGLGTCNGCHYNETKTQQLHVSNRDFGFPAELSNFLSVRPTSTTSYQASDPVTGLNVIYNEPRRRICEFLWLEAGNFSRLTRTSGN